MFLLAEIRPIRLDIWHDEPGGHDSFEVCGYPPHGLRRVAWGLRHIQHLHYRFWPYLRIKRWLRDRCGECGRRFLYRDARHGYQSSDTVYHEACMSLRHVRGQLDDLTGYVLGTADDNARWRAEYRLEGIEKKARETTP
jgi:hypothetical protein